MVRFGERRPASALDIDFTDYIFSRDTIFKG